MSERPMANENRLVYSTDGGRIKADAPPPLGVRRGTASCGCSVRPAAEKAKGCV